MNPYQRYFLDEFIEDYESGRLGRRDFIRRVVAVSGGVAAAAALLRTFGLTERDINSAYAAAPADVVREQASALTVAPDDPEIRAAPVEFAGLDDATLSGYFAQPAQAGTYPGIVVIHENRGLTPHIQDVVRRYAKSGFAALAPDLISREGGTSQATDPAQIPGFLSQADPLRHTEDAIAAGNVLRDQERVNTEAHGITGFCFGGGVTWRTAVSDPVVAAAVAYYGSPPALDAAARMKAAALGIYGELDTRITASVPDLEAALTTAGVPHELVVYPGADHAFFNDTGERYEPNAAADAWSRTLEWFRAYLPAAEG